MPSIFDPPGVFEIRIDGYGNRYGEHSYNNADANTYLFNPYQLHQPLNLTIQPFGIHTGSQFFNGLEPWGTSRAISSETYGTGNSITLFGDLLSPFKIG